MIIGEENWWDKDDPDEYSPDEYDAQIMYEYLEWKTGPYYAEFKHIDMGTPPSALSPEIEWAYQNDDALRLLEPRLSDLDMTIQDAMRILVDSLKTATALDEKLKGEWWKEE